MGPIPVWDFRYSLNKGILFVQHLSIFLRRHILGGGVLVWEKCKIKDSSSVYAVLLFE